MKIVIVGPGAMGCFMAASLSVANEVWLLDHDPGRAALLNRQGLVLEEEGRATKFPVRVTADPQLIKSADLVFLCVKAGQVQEALRTMRGLLGHRSLLLALQNGIGHLSLLPDALDTAWGLGVTSHGATLVEPGHVFHQGRGPTRIGFSPDSIPNSDEVSGRMAAAAQTLSEAGILTEVVPDILNHVWAKLLVNVGINALTAIHNCPNGALLESAELVTIMESAIVEGQAVAAESGISLAADPIQVAKEVCLATSANISSMLQDVRAKKPTEIEAINGALLRKGRELGIAMPVNRELVRAIKEIERGY